MRRRLYLVTLPILQLALIAKLAPPLALALSVEIAPGTAPAGWPALAQLVAAGAAIVGAALTLSFPGIVLARHRRGGLPRFLGLPRAGVTMAMSGAAAICAGSGTIAAYPLLPEEARIVATCLGPPVVAGGLALTTAGVLCAELLRRGIARGAAAAGAVPRRPGRIEVTHPPELRTRAA
jgi:glycine/D-amino acid oxidase-like deaminating enzyme